MTEKKNNEIPMCFVSDSDGEFDARAILDAVPQKLGKYFAFFRKVPEWFETGADNLDVPGHEVPSANRTHVQ